MKTVSVKQARQQFSRLIEQAGGGSSVLITRRGRTVACLGPASPPQKAGLPDLAEFRNSLGKPKRRGGSIERLRKAQRY